MTDKPQHSPTPWKVSFNQAKDKPSCEIKDSNKSSICFMSHGQGQSREAKHIVHCVNNHDALVEALEWALDSLKQRFEDPSRIKDTKAWQTLKNAKGE